MGGYDVYFNAGILLSAGIAYVSLFCTLLTLFVIYDMNKWNGYMRLVFNLSVCQCFTDFTFILCSYSLHKNITLFDPARNFFFTFGCITVSMWTNLMSCILFNVVIYRRNLNVHKYFDRIRAAIVIPGLVAGVTFAVLTKRYYNELEGTLLWSQFFSVVFNLVIWVIVTISLRQMVNESSETSGGADNAADLRETRYSNYHKSVNEPIIELSRRIKYYPIVQIISLLGITWYFFAYILHLFGDGDMNLQLAVWYIYSVLSPAAGIGYFVVFLTVQPYAYKHLSRRIREFLGVPIDRTISAQSEIYRTSSASTVSYSVDSQAYGAGSEHAGHPALSGLRTHVSSLTASTVSFSNPIAVVDCAGMDDDALIEHIEHAYRTRSKSNLNDQVPQVGGGGINPLVRGVGGNDVL